MFDYEEFIQGLESQKKEALASSDAKKYFNSVLELGEEPESLDLFERGELEVKKGELEIKIEENISLQKEADSFDDRQISTENNRIFYSKAKSIDTNFKPELTEDKRKLLQDNYHKFSAEGKQDITNYNHGKITKVFDIMVNYAEKNK